MRPNPILEPPLVPPPGARRVATVREVERYARLSKTVIYGLLNDGVLQGYKPFKKKLLVDLDSVDNYLKAMPPWTPKKAKGGSQ